MEAKIVYGFTLLLLLAIGFGIGYGLRWLQEIAEAEAKQFQAWRKQIRKEERARQGARRLP